MAAFQPQSVAILIWAYATLAFTHLALMLASAIRLSALMSYAGMCYGILSPHEYVGKLYAGLMDAAARHNIGTLVTIFQHASSQCLLTQQAYLLINLIVQASCTKG